MCVIVCVCVSIMNIFMHKYQAIQSNFLKYPRYVFGSAKVRNAI